jgi:hypothetical protein
MAEAVPEVLSKEAIRAGFVGSMPLRANSARRLDLYDLKGFTRVGTTKPSSLLSDMALHRKTAPNMTCDTSIEINGGQAAIDRGAFLNLRY